MPSAALFYARQALNRLPAININRPGASNVKDPSVIDRYRHRWPVRTTSSSFAPFSFSCHRGGGGKPCQQICGHSAAPAALARRFLVFFLDDALVLVLTFAVIIFDPSNWHLREQPACLCPPLRTHPSSAPWPGIYSGRGRGALASPLHPSSISLSFPFSFCLPFSLIK